MLTSCYVNLKKLFRILEQKKDYTMFTDGMKWDVHTYIHLHLQVWTKEIKKNGYTSVINNSNVLVVENNRFKLRLLSFSSEIWKLGECLRGLGGFKDACFSLGNRSVVRGWRQMPGGP